MELLGVRRHVPAPGRVRLTGTVRYDGGASNPEEIWFEVPEAYAGDLSDSGNAWLAVLAPLAAWHGEPVRIGLPVDRVLARNVVELSRVWRSWNPRFREIPLEVTPVDADGGAAASARTAAFFSGGMDSLFTLIWHGRTQPGRLRIDELVCVHGFDIPLSKSEDFGRHRDRLSATAAAFGKPLLEISTNLRATRLREVPWGEVLHGPALAAAGLVLERRFSALLIASTSPYAELEPWGSHPLTDPLLSTERTQVLHDGAGFNRAEKTLHVIAGGDAALSSLHVCFRDASDRNCGQCRKCTLAMTSLEVLGVLSRCPTFPAGGPSLERVRRLHLPLRSQRAGVGRLRSLARERGRDDLARAIGQALRRSRARAGILSGLDVLDRVRGLGRVSRRLRKRVMAGAIR